MSELNERFPGILLGYVAGTGISLTAEACNELSKFVSGIEVERDSYKARFAWQEEVAKNAIITLKQLRSSLYSERAAKEEEIKTLMDKNRELEDRLSEASQFGRWER